MHALDIPLRHQSQAEEESHESRPTNTGTKPGHACIHKQRAYNDDEFHAVIQRYEEQHGTEECSNKANMQARHRKYVQGPGPAEDFPQFTSQTSTAPQGQTTGYAVLVIVKQAI